MSGMDIIAAEGLPAVRVIRPHRHQDARGYFSEVWREDAMRQAGIDVRFVQENHTLSRIKGTIRGLHFQIGPAAQGKLVRCVRGSIFDVAVDIRRGSPTFGRHVSLILSTENWKQLYVPIGFAHGYCTLEPETEVTYKVTAYYDPASERGLAWDDPEIGIAWPVDGEKAVLVSRDRLHPRLSELSDVFTYASYPD
jgi:dTDP-4-dehydrorhamnose 3,5-epimerase